jgi:hypothetical protein
VLPHQTNTDKSDTLHKVLQNSLSVSVSVSKRSDYSGG